MLMGNSFSPNCKHKAQIKIISIVDGENFVIFIFYYYFRSLKKSINYIISLKIVGPRRFIYSK